MMADNPRAIAVGELTPESELSEEQAIAAVRVRFPQSVAQHDDRGWYVRAVDAEGNLYGFFGRKPTGPEAWIEAAKLLQLLSE